MHTAFLARAEALIRSDVDLDELCLRLDEGLRQHVRYGGAAWATHDPATGLTTSCLLTGVPRDDQRESVIFAHEFHDGEPATYFDLITAGRTVAVLSEETEGDLARAGRWRDVFSQFGVTDELRAILWSGGQPWGSLSLYRMGGTFTAVEVALVEALASVVADGIRLALLRAAASRPTAVADPPGVLEVTPDGTVVAVTDPGVGWLQVGGEPLASTARMTAAAAREHRDWVGTSSRVVTAAGRVLTLHASSSRHGDGTVLVVVDAARPAQVGAMLVDAYGLTDRQRDVLGLLLLGRSMTQIAGALGISEHTANDHRKALYARTGVNSRSELAALLQHEQYDPRARSGVTPSPYGGYLDA
jgi:DNA-binding CsgD family transcriptional regulator